MPVHVALSSRFDPTILKFVASVTESDPLNAGEAGDIPTAMEPMTVPAGAPALQVLDDRDTEAIACGGGEVAVAKLVRVRGTIAQLGLFAHTLQAQLV